MQILNRNIQLRIIKYKELKLRMFLILEKRKSVAYATLPLSASLSEAGQYGRAVD